MKVIQWAIIGSVLGILEEILYAILFGNGEPMVIVIFTFVGALFGLSKEYHVAADRIIAAINGDVVEEASQVEATDTTA